jgi:hypothetical protein
MREERDPYCTRETSHRIWWHRRAQKSKSDFSLDQEPVRNSKKAFLPGRTPPAAMPYLRLLWRLSILRQPRQSATELSRARPGVAWAGTAGHGQAVYKLLYPLRHTSGRMGARAYPGQIPCMLSGSKLARFCIRTEQDALIWKWSCPDRQPLLWRNGKNAFTLPVHYRDAL